MSRSLRATVLLLLATWAYGTRLIHQEERLMKDGLPTNRPYNIAHRGASAELPEHTVEAYKRAIEQGADMIECDMVLTRDLEIVCRHEPLLSGTTDANQKFPNLIKNITIDGTNYTGVFSTDLTLNEIKTLRAKQPLAFRDQSFNGKFSVPTLEEHLEVALGAGRVVGVTPEIKHSTWHNSLDIVKKANTTFEDILLKKLTSLGYNNAPDTPPWAKKPIIIQSFEVENLKYLNKRSPMALAQLVNNLILPIPGSRNLTYANLTTDQGLKDVAQYAYVYASWKNNLVPINTTTNTIGNVTSLGERAKKTGMKLVTWTMRNEERYLPFTYQRDPFFEYDKFVEEVGVDGMFTDQPATLARYFTHREALQGKQHISHVGQELAEKRPWNIAHRGSSGVLPEHTVEAYQLAVKEGADFIECDMVLTRDLRVVCRHEPLLSGTTNADELFPKLNKTIRIDGENYTGVFSTDLTLEEVKKLRAKQAFAIRDQSFNGKFSVPTLEEYLDVAQKAGRVVGVIPEIKHSAWHNSLDIVKKANTTFEDIVLRIFTQYGYTGPLNSKEWRAKPLFIQSFEFGNLRYLASKSSIPLVALLDEVSPEDGRTWEQLTTQEELAKIKTFAQAVGPWKNMIVPTNTTTKKLMASTGLAERLKKNGFIMTPYTFRNEAERYLAFDYVQDARAEYDLFLKKLGVDAVFTDFPATLSEYLRYNTAIKYKWD